MIEFHFVFKVLAEQHEWSTPVACISSNVGMSSHKVAWPQSTFRLCHLGVLLHCLSFVTTCLGNFSSHSMISGNGKVSHLFKKHMPFNADVKGGQKMKVQDNMQIQPIQSVKLWCFIHSRVGEVPALKWGRLNKNELFWCPPKHTLKSQCQQEVAWVFICVFNWLSEVLLYCCVHLVTIKSNGPVAHEQFIAVGWIKTQRTDTIPPNKVRAHVRFYASNRIFRVMTLRSVMRWKQAHHRPADKQQRTFKWMLHLDILLTWELDF